MATIPPLHSGGTTVPPTADVATPAAARPATSDEGPSTHAPRRPASAVPSIEGLRISPPGFKATLINISTTGLLAEWGLPLKIGQEVTIEFEGKLNQHSVRARVVRSAAASITSASLRYHVGLAFTTPIAFEDQTPSANSDAKAPDSISDVAQLDDVVNQW